MWCVLFKYFKTKESHMWIYAIIRNLFSILHLLYFVLICHVCQYHMIFYFHLKGIWCYLMLCCHILHKNPSNAKRCFITIKDFMDPLNWRTMNFWAIVSQIPYAFGFVIFSSLQLCKANGIIDKAYRIVLLIILMVLSSISDLRSMTGSKAVLYFL